MDDEYNAIGGGFDDHLLYPDDTRNDSEEPPVLTELNGIGKRPGKRRLEELSSFPSDEHFAHPIDWHMRMPLTIEEREAKRYKQLIEDEIVERITNKIVETRNKRHEEPVEVEVETSLQTTGEIMRLPPVDGTAWIGVSGDGSDERFYIRLRKLKISRQTERLVGTKGAFANAQYAQILKEAEEIRTRKTLNPDTDEMEPEDHETMSTKSEALWVDAFAPKTFADLLSDDGTNRSVLTWLKMWDECVFHKKIVNVDAMVADSEKDKEICSLDSGKWRRPRHKVLLLSGPPGLGKTTLAQIVARHTGYATVEVNASDNRNVADFDRLLDGAARCTKTIDLSGAGKPTCLIIDEIDGAPIEAIRFLVKAIQGTGKKALRRPIICICNNLFTPALRELRPIALSVTVHSTKEDRLINRLSTISDIENVRTDRNTLQHLVKLCHSDVRLCINVLQFVAVAARSQHRAVTISDIKKAIEHERVGSPSLFDGWSLILEHSHHTDNKGVLKNDSLRLKTVEYVALECGGDRFVTGLHSNYARFQLPVGTLSKASKTFVFYDLLNDTILKHQNYSLQRYLLAFYGILHLSIATHIKIPLKYPQFEQNMALRARESTDTVSSIRSRAGSHGCASNDLVKDTLPLLITIVQPPIRPMNEHLYNKRELSVMQNAVAIMSSFELTFSANMVNSELHYTFQPPVDVLTMYNLSDVNHRLTIPSTTRQFIARQIATYKSRHAITSNETTTADVTKESREKRLQYPVSKPCRPSVLFFRYNQGFSNAVKKNVRMCNLLP